MNKKTLGHSSIEIVPLMFGGNVFGWTADEKMSFEILDRFVDQGFNFIDTADVYSNWVPGNSGGESEIILGKWFKKTGKRNRVVLATKLGFSMGPGQEGLSRKYIFQAVDASLRRLQTDVIDLYQSHTDDQTVALEETMQAFHELVQAGKVRMLGASNHQANRFKQALEVSKQQGITAYQCLQPLYNLYDRNPFESEMESLCLEQKVSVIPYYSLAAGFLTGKYRSESDFDGSKSKRGERVKKYFTARGIRILGALDQVAKEKQIPQTQVALAWLMARPSVTAPIVSATNLEQLEQVMDALHVKLSPSEIQLLNQASAEDI